MESILCAIEALSVTDHYSSKICSNKELFNIVCDLVKLTDKSELSSQCVTAAVLLANMIMDEPDFASCICHDLSFLNGLFDTLPFASDDPEARNAIWSTVGTLLESRDSAYSDSNEQQLLVLLLTSKVEVIEEDLLNQQHHSSTTQSTSLTINSYLGRIMGILTEWSSSQHAAAAAASATTDTTPSVHHVEVSILFDCCRRFYIEIST